MKPLDPSRLALVSSERIAQVSFNLVSRLQTDFTPEEQAVGYAALFLLTCRRFGAHPGNVMEIAGNVLRQHAEKHPEFAASRDYLNKELS